MPIEWNREGDGPSDRSPGPLRRDLDPSLAGGSPLFRCIPDRAGRHVSRRLSILLAVSALVLAAGEHRQALHADDEEKAPLSVPELDAVKDSIRALDLKAAEDGLKAAKKELREQRDDESVESAIEAVEHQIAALEEFSKARRYVKKRKYPQALTAIAKALRAPEELLFSDEAEDLYSEIKQKMYYMICDFESEDSRNPANFYTSGSGVTAAIVNDLRLSSDGRHALEVHFVALGDGIRPHSSEAYRAIILKPPPGFSRDIGGLRCLQFSIVANKKVPDLVTVDIFGGDGSIYAEHPGIALNFTGRKQFTLKLNRFKFYGSFQWSDAQDIRFSTLGPSAMDFSVDDVKFLR